MKDNQEIAKDYTEWLVKTGGCARDMTLRDHFAGLALQGLVIHANGETYNEIAKKSYTTADAMLKERNK